MANKNWEKFYKEKKAPIRHSKFAEDVVEFFSKRDDFKNLLDVGAGNGRDTKWLHKTGLFNAIGIDKNYVITTKKYVKGGFVIKLDFNEYSELNADIVYSRFFLHSIKDKEIKHLVKITPKYFVAEFRIKGDKPVLYTKHKRNFVDLGWLINLLLKEGFEILNIKAGYGLAKYKEEDPLVARIYAKRLS